ncbi:MAG: hypothetical protein LBF97_07880, partial [Elusimicrobiota bacterium]|nr:hypothetical protein [Elusimicrobiota bacterium]
MAYSFDLDRCNFGFKYNGVSYEFDNITSDVIDNPEEQHITRGSNRKDIRGIRYKVNMNQPIVRTQIIKGIPKDILELLQSI